MNNATPYYAPPPRRRNILPFVILGVVCAIIFIAILIGIVVFIFSGTEDSFNTPNDDYVGVLHIEGTISSQSTTGLLYTEDAVYNQNYILSSIYEMKNDPNNCGILLYFNTPGGELYATNEVYEELLLYKEETGRPIYAYFAEYACSGGYYLAMTADDIVANPMSTTGSIGVTYGAHINIAGLCEKLWVGVEEITSGANKAMGSYFSPMTNEQKAIYQSQIAEYYEVFLQVVLQGRPSLTREDLLPIADGRTFTARQALEAGLIDDIMRLDEYKAYIATYDFEDDVSFYDFFYVPAQSDLLATLASAITKENTPASELMATLSVLKPLSGALVYYAK